MSHYLLNEYWITCYLDILTLYSRNRLTKVASITAQWDMAVFPSLVDIARVTPGSARPLVRVTTIIIYVIHTGIGKDIRNIVPKIIINRLNSIWES